jgi:hypothetical protein
MGWEVLVHDELANHALYMSAIMYQRRKICIWLTPWVLR